jgi:hypothetical protein
MGAAVLFLARAALALPCRRSLPPRAPRGGADAARPSSATCLANSAAPRASPPSPLSTKGASADPDMVTRSPVNWCLVLEFERIRQISPMHCVHPSPRTSERQGPALIWPLGTIPKPIAPDDVGWRSLSYHAHHSCTANSTSSEAANRYIYTVCMSTSTIFSFHALAVSSSHTSITARKRVAMMRCVQPTVR